LECDIHQVTPAKRKLFQKLFLCRERQLLQEVRTKATSPRSKFAKELALKKNAAEDEAYGGANITSNKQLQFQMRLSDAETEATSPRWADTECVANELERDIYDITSNEMKGFKTVFSIHKIEFEACWETIGIQALRKIIEQHVMHSRYPMMRLVSHIPESICRIDSGENFTPDIAEWLHIANVKQAYRSSNKVNYIRQMLTHNDRFTSSD
jgi:hypothetical protein